MSRSFVQEPTLTVTAAVRLDLLWPEFAKFLDGTYKALLPQCLETSESYQVFCMDEGIVYVCTLVKAPADYAETFDTQGKIDEHLGYKTVFEAKWKPKCNRTTRTPDGRVRIASEKTSKTKTTFFSHDWCDPTTWYETAVRVVDEEPTPNGAFTVYTLAHNNVIDAYHGKISQEDYLKDSGGNSYRVIVKVNGTTKTEQDPHFGSGGDYTINYDQGSITFLSALTENDEVLVTYHYMVDSLFTIRPAAGKGLLIEQAEVQFSDDLILNDSAIFQPYGYVDVFAPQLMPGIPSGTKIPLGSPVVYKTMRDYQNDAFKSYPLYPAIGGPGWRGIQQPTLVLDWDYRSSTVLRSDYGMEIRIKLQHDTPFGGSYGTATFYCVVEDL